MRRKQRKTGKGSKGKRKDAGRQQSEGKGLGGQTSPHALGACCPNSEVWKTGQEASDLSHTVSVTLGRLAHCFTPHRVPRYSGNDNVPCFVSAAADGQAPLRKHVT